MNKMVKTLATVAVMFVAVSTAAQAQGGGGGGGRGRGGPNYMAIFKDSLHTTEAVAMKADSIAKSYQAKQQEMRAAGGDPAAMQPKMAEMTAARTKDLKALLTADQVAAYDKIMAAMPQGRRGGGR